MRRRNLFLLGLFSLWGIFVPLWLLLTYRPTLPLDNLVFDDMAFVLCLFGISAAFGWRLQGGILVRGEGRPEDLFYAVLLGLGGLSLLTFFVGLLGGYRLGGFLGILSGVTLWSRRGFVPVARMLRRRLSGVADGETAAKLGMLFAALLMVFHTLVPPTIRDELIAHLAYPKIFLRAGRIVELPFTSFSYYPLGLDLLFGMAMSCASDIAARLLHAGVGILSLWGLYLVARRICGRRCALWATFFFAQLPLVVLTGGKAYVDMGVILYLMGALLAFDDHVRGGGRGALVRSGIFLGLAFGVKYNALLFVPVFSFVLLWRLARRPPRQALIEGMALFLPFLLVASPWMIRNVWLTGNPLFPFYNGIFHGKELMPGLETIPELQFRVETMGWGAQFLIPWLVSVEMTGREVYAADGIIGPLFLVFAPFGWFVVRRRPMLLKFLGFVTLGYFVVAWFIGGVRLRYYLPMLPFCAILAARGWRFFLRVKGIRLLAIVVGGGLIAYNFVVSTTYLRQADPWPFLLGVQDREDYLLQHLPDYRYMKFMNERLPPDATVMLIHSNRGYYLDRDYRYDAKFGGYTLKRILRESRSAAEMTRHFRELGISHLYIDLRGLQIDLGADPLGKDREKMLILQRFLFRELEILLQDGRAMIAALPPKEEKRHGTAG